MFRHFLSALALSGMLVLASVPAHATTVSFDDPAYLVGSPDAPITIVEYSSYTCNHCAAFHKEVFPRLKKEWIDTGKVKLISRDFPLDQVALGISMLTYCAPKDKYPVLKEAFFMRQNQWIQSKNLRLDLFTIAREIGGLSEPESAKCLTDQDLAKQLQDRQRDSVDELDINATPTFTVNGQIIRGAPSYDELVKIIRSAGD